MSDKRLFTPGPLTTSQTVKEAMLHDVGSREAAFTAIVRDIRQRLLQLVGQEDASQYTTVLMQGSGTFGLEAVIGSAIPPGGKLLVVVNGAYGRRMAQIAKLLNIETATLSYPENTTPDAGEIDSILVADSRINMVAVVHCETTTGILNPVAEIGETVGRHRREYLVDAMSSLGGIPLDIAQAQLTYLVASANKCIEGVPGFAFILAAKAALQKTEGYARSLSLDLFGQWQGLEKNGQFRFTPPTHALLAFQQALHELEHEGGVAGRHARYRANHRALVNGMRQIGFRPYLSPGVQAPIITAFHYPEHPNFVFEDFYEHLSTKGFIIYPGKLSEVDCFRIGNIGRLRRADMEALLAAVRETLQDMQITL